jgi:isoleucyl-tRNA synthetase
MKLNNLIKDVRGHYENYCYYKVYHALNLFFTVDLSARYLDILKDRLYVEHEDSNLRRSSQYVLSKIVKETSFLMAPILSFLSDEVYEHLNVKEKKESVFLESMPEFDETLNDDVLLQEYEELFELRSEVSKALEEMRADKKIRASLEAQLILSTKHLKQELWEKYKDSLAELFIVSKVKYMDNNEELKVLLAEGEKCPRCWHIVELKEHSIGESLCKRCTEVMNKIV